MKYFKYAKEKDLGSPAGDILISYLGAGAAAQASATALGKSMMNDIKDSKGMTDAQKKKLQRKMKVTKVIGPEETRRGVGPAIAPNFDNKGKLTKSTPLNIKNVPEEIVAHEYGHAKNYKALGRGAKPAFMLGRVAAPAVGGLAGLAMAATADDPDSTQAKAAPWVASGSHVGTLLDEGAASYHALKATGRKGLKNLSKGFGTYALMAAAPGAGLEIARRIRSKRKKKNAAASEGPSQS